MTSCGIFPSGDFRPGSGTKATTNNCWMTIIPISAVYFMLLFNQLNRTMSCILLYILVSSANIYALDVTVSRTSLINAINELGTITVPWGTPLITSLEVDEHLLSCTIWDLLFKKSWIQFSIWCIHRCTFIQGLRPIIHDTNHLDICRVA